MEVLFGILVALVCLTVWATPIYLIAKSGVTQGNEKIAWILLVIFFSWFSWVFYMLLAPLKPENKANH